jgi:hypothetical protein
LRLAGLHCTCLVASRSFIAGPVREPPSRPDVIDERLLDVHGPCEVSAG